MESNLTHVPSGTLQPSGTDATQPVVWDAASVRMSFFTAPITNKWPSGEPLSLFAVYCLIRQGRYMDVTRRLRLIADHDEQRRFKGLYLDYFTPSGVFSYCNDQSLLRHSQVLCMDLDDLGGRVEELFLLLQDDPYFDTLLLFRSPTGRGLKWLVHIDLARCDHRTWFAAVRNYLMAAYHLTERQVDPQCANPSRACYLCHDEEAYLKTELIEIF